MAHPVRPVTVRALIPADPDAVLAYVADTRNDPEWCPNVDSAELVSGDGVAVGSVFRYHQHLDAPGSQRIELDGEVTVLELTSNSIRWRVTDRMQERDITLRVEPHADGCRITQTTRATFRRPPGIARWGYPLLAWREFRRQFAGLARQFS
jgi:hypothetical protein